MAIKIPFKRAANTVKNMATMLQMLKYDATSKAEEKTFIELIIDRGPIGVYHYYVPVDENNLVELEDEKKIMEIANALRMEVITKEGEILKFPDKE